MPKVALLLGSLRRPGNGIGIASWLTPVLRQGLQDSRSAGATRTSLTDVVFLDPTKAPLPLGPIVDGSHVPSDIRDPTKHPNPAVRDFATLVSSFDGFVVLSPEYNGSYPGELKNTLDHLYWEWRNKPVVVVTYGGGGGTRCAGLLRSLLGGAFKMRVAEKGVAIKLPRSHSNGVEKVPTKGPAPDWLEAYKPEVLDAVEELKQLLAAKP
ncbi:flavoprotein [Lenzites betulinus]|nr:flavoprotein [Lenzites betulinus]